ncbi:MAG: Integrase [Campylobacterota bacterium]|nr:Integrase [Campylobacterota bacterium]
MLEGAVRGGKINSQKVVLTNSGSLLHIQKQFGKKRLDQIKPSDLAVWQNRMLETLATKTVKTIRTVFNAVFDDAMKDEIIKRNPFTLIRSPTGEEMREKKPFSLEEIDLILSNAPKSMKAFFAIGFFTGMRTGEIIGLRWSDIDYEENIIKVQRSRRQGIESLPKTKNSIRDVEILDTLKPFILEHQELSDDNKSGYVFETSFGRPFNTTDKISYWYWRPLLKELDIPYRNLYQMRHTFASMMISEGEDILWVSNMLGHKDSSMTLQKYARYIKNTKKKRAQFLNEKLSSS